MLLARARRALSVLCTAGVVGAVLVGTAAPAAAAPALTIRPITWDVIGLDSNSPATGPDTFPVGARICNTGDAPALALASDLLFDSTNANIAADGPTSLSLGDLAAGACRDAYFNVVVAKTAAAFGTARQYRVTAAATGVTPVATPSGRQLFVEKLVSQARNDVTGISGSALLAAPSDTAQGTARVVVGETYTFRVDSKTATGGYEQLESFLTFPTALFQVLSTRAVYAQPAGATNDTLYADACGWDPIARDCVGPVTYTGGKAGGSPIATDYTVKVVRAGTGRLNTLIYDFSGSSFHYNGDFGTSATSVSVTAVDPPALSLTKSHTGDLQRGTPGTYDLTVTNAGGPTSGPITVVDTLPAGMSLVSSTDSGWSCSSAGQTVTCSDARSLATGATRTLGLTVLAGSTTPTAVVNTATVSTAGDPSDATATDPTYVNSAPVAVADARTTPAGTPVVLDPRGNDTDPDTGTTLFVTDAGPASSGSVLCSTTSCSYTPASGFAGTATFPYTVADGHGGTATATVTITVTPPPAAAADAGDVLLGSSTTIQVLGNDVLGTGPTTVTSWTPATSGAVSCTPQGACTYGPAGRVGDDTFTYTITDSTGATSTATVTVSVAAVPGAVDDSTEVAAGKTVTVPVLDNDDLGTRPTTITSFTQGGTGAVTCSATACTYGPSAQVGADSFTYTITDAKGSKSTATVAVTVNPVPTAVDDVAEVALGGSVTVPVLGNDTAGTGTTTITTFGQGGHGDVSCTATVCTYGPAEEVGADSFTYTIKDAKGSTSTATVAVTVNAVPKAVDDVAEVALGGSVTVPVMGNDTAGTGTTTITTFGQGGHGDVSCTATVCTYGPAEEVGADSFTYTITDAKGSKSTATVAVTVNAVPKAEDDVAEVALGGSVTVPVMDNDTAGTGTTTITTFGQGGHGDVTCTATACTYGPAEEVGADSFTYTIKDARGSTSTATVAVTVRCRPGCGRTTSQSTYGPAEEVGADSFTYTITDAKGSTSTATVAVTVNAVPGAADDVAEVLVGGSVTVEVLDNDGLGTEPTWITSFTPGAHGDVSCSAADCTYGPAGKVGSDSFTYTITDAKGSTSTATVTVTVHAVPGAADDVAEVLVGGSVTVEVLDNDGLGTEPTSITGFTSGAHGDVSCSTTACTYGPAESVGADAFTYTITDSRGSTSTATVEVTVHAVPEAADDAARTGADRPVTVDVLANDVHGTGTQVVAVATGPTSGQATCATSGCTYTPALGFVGDDSFTYTVTDSRGTPSTATVRITVLPPPSTPAVPAAHDDSAEVVAGRSVVVDVMADDVPGTGAHTVAVSRAPASGTATCTATACTYAPAAGFVGQDSFEYVLTDANGAASTATVSITVLAAPAPPVVAPELDPVDTPPTVVPAPPVTAPRVDASPAAGPPPSAEPAPSVPAPAPAAAGPPPPAPAATVSAPPAPVEALPAVITAPAPSAGVVITPTAPSAGAAVGQLPRTGSTAAGGLRSGLGLLMLGLALTVVGRRRSWAD